MDERLQKILAHAGVASRRAAEKLIAEGRVRVNGQTVRQLGVRADARRDRITVDGQRVRTARAPVYILLNKPRNVVSTSRDPEGRSTVLDLVGHSARERIYPAGRLDFGSEGLMILTNDGEFTHFLTRAGAVPKVYRVKVSGAPSDENLERLRRGVVLDGVRTAPCEILPVRTGNNSWFEVTLRQGKNRQIRRMFESIGHPVMKLRRTRIGFLEDRHLEPGAWRKLTGSEVARFYSQYARAADRPHSGERPARRRRPAARVPGASGAER